jgi:hypothetical protein
MTILTNDIESNKEIAHSDIHLPLRGILKKPEENSFDDKKIKERLSRLCLGLIIFVCMTPMIFCDLYFGFNDTICSKEQPDELAINLKLYLIVSSFIRFSAMTVMLMTITCVDTDKISNLGTCFMFCGSLTIICLALFNIVWDILGAVVFWGYIYGNGNCDKTFSTYVFVSLIIKFGADLFAYQVNKKNDNN